MLDQLFAWLRLDAFSRSRTIALNCRSTIGDRSSPRKSGTDFSAWAARYRICLISSTGSLTVSVGGFLAAMQCMIVTNSLQLLGRFIIGELAQNEKTKSEFLHIDTMTRYGY